MAVVVSDTTPLHYLILVGQEFVLEKLYGRVIIPPAVLIELSHPSAPVQISTWAANPPTWVNVATPRSIPSGYEGLDFGERQALALAKELSADLVLLDDKVARLAAFQEKLKVKGTLGIVADAARANLLDFFATVKQLQNTNMHLKPDVIDEILREFDRTRRKV